MYKQWFKNKVEHRQINDVECEFIAKSMVILLKFPLAYNMEFVENRPTYKINFFSNFGKI
jgi:hypothetical protein